MVGGMEKLEELSWKDEGSGKVLWWWLLGLGDRSWRMLVGGDHNRDALERDDGFGLHGVVVGNDVDCRGRRGCGGILRAGLHVGQLSVFSIASNRFITN